MITIRYKSFLTLSMAAFFGLASCTDLEDKVLDRPSADDLSGLSGTIDPQSALQGAYGQLNTLTNQANTYALQEHSTDEMMGPTRGTDWSDFGTWRRLHQHSWDPLHNQVIDTWNEMNTGVFRATQAIAFAGSDTRIKAEATFLRAFFMFQVVDLYGQVPYREVTDDPDASPKVYTRSEGIDLVIQDLTASLPGLTATNAGKANVDAARFLLAKAYLNKAIYKQDPNAPAGPFNFAADDMTEVVKYCDLIINSGKYQLSEYFDNFHWDNTTRSKELIFVIQNEKGAAPGSVQNRYYMTSHYNQPLNGGGWNGFTTLADFYNSFEPADKRFKTEVPGMSDKFGFNAGFLAGQQYDIREGNKNPLKTRGGSPLIFTPDVDLLYSNESRGIRVVKYFPEPIPNPKAAEADQPDFINESNPGTDYVFFRYADVLLMKAEAILRGGTGTGTATELVNQVRTSRGASSLANVDLPALLAERGRELYWEGWRRNDMIRFGTFLNPMDQKPNTSPAHVVVYPIPQRALDTNPNLKQNFGY
jgi:hypothetical protein